MLVETCYCTYEKDDDVLVPCKAFCSTLRAMILSSTSVKCILYCTVAPTVCVLAFCVVSFEFCLTLFDLGSNCERVKSMQVDKRVGAEGGAFL